MPNVQKQERDVSPPVIKSRPQANEHNVPDVQIRAEPPKGSLGDLFGRGGHMH